MDLKRLGPFVIERELGAGGMGKVYAASVGGRAPGLTVGSVVALKVVHPHLLEMPGFFMRFMREASLGASIQHENVVRTHHCDQLVVDGTAHAYLVLEYVEGQDLRDLGRELERVPEELCRHIGREIAKGLAAIHAGGVVHRDIKPENVLITSEHVVKIMDLGIARLEDDNLHLSRSGMFIGSVEYASPEQFDGGDVDARCDLHALGLILYELSTGQHPYRADGFKEVMKRVCEEVPRRIGEIHPQLSPFLEELVHTLLAKSRDDRFASANDVLAALEEGEDSQWWHDRAKALRAETKRPLRRIRIPRETQVYGRDTEIARLRSLFDAAQSGDGNVVLIEGEAGIGKSRLVDELIGQLQQSGEDFNFVFGGYPPGGAATASGAFSTAYREQLGDAGSAAYLVETPILVPAFDALLKGESAPTGMEILTKDSLQTCFVNVTRALARERTTIVLIDDLHFAPDAGRALFTALAMAVPGQRVLLVGTTRPGVSEEWTAGLTRLAQTTQIELARLGPKDLVALLHDAFGSQSLAESLGLQIVLKSDGNPFFAFEILRGLREGQFIKQRDDGTWASTSVIEEIQIPSSVLDLVNARVADLSQEERDLLDVAACCGYEFDPGIIAQAVGEPLLPTLKRFAAIEKKHRLVRASGRQLVFDHHQVQEALYGALYEQMREAYHAALADALETRARAADAEPDALDGALCCDLCEHFLKGAQGDRALRYLAAAQAHASSGNVHAQAVMLAELALAVPRMLVGTERAQVLLRTSASVESLGRQERQREMLKEAVALADADGDAGLRARAHRLFGHFLERVYENDAALAELQLGLDLAREAGESSVEGAALNCMSLVLAHTGRFEEAETMFETAIALRHETGDRAGEAGSTINLGVVYGNQGRTEEACDAYRRGLAICREIGHRQFESAAVGNLGSVLHAQGRLEEAGEHFERVLELSREIGNRRTEITARGNLGRTWQALGESERARESFEISIELGRQVGARSYVAADLLGLGSCLRSAGDHAGAARVIEESLEIRRDISDVQGIAYAAIELADALRATGDTERAIAMAREGVRVATESDQREPRVLGLVLLATLPGGDADEALRAFEEARETCNTAQVRWFLWQATDDRMHLEAAKSRMDASIAKVPERYHDLMRRDLWLNREIMAAWCGDAGGDENTDRTVLRDNVGGGDTEAATRVG